MALIRDRGVVGHIAAVVAPYTLSDLVDAGFQGSTHVELDAQKLFFWSTLAGIPTDKGNSDERRGNKVQAWRNVERFEGTD